MKAVPRRFSRGFWQDPFRRIEKVCWAQARQFLCLVCQYSFNFLITGDHLMQKSTVWFTIVQLSAAATGRPLCWLQAFLFFDVFSMSLRREQHRGSLHSGYETWKRHGRPSIPHSQTAKRSLGIRGEDRINHIKTYQKAWGILRHLHLETLT